MPKILLIDDEKAPLKFRATLLRICGYEVAATQSGEEALALFSQQRFDLVITDWLMPALTGFDLARQFKQLHPTTKIIMLIGWGQHLQPEFARRQGIDQILAKPCQAERLLELVGRLLSASQDGYPAQFQNCQAA